MKQRNLFIVWIVNEFRCILFYQIEEKNRLFLIKEKKKDKHLQVYLYKKSIYTEKRLVLNQD